MAYKLFFLLKILFSRLYVILLLLSYSHAQIPILSQQPYFRGLISALPGPSNQEFIPVRGDTFRPVVTIRDGALWGFTLRTVYGRAISSFQSIPFAQSPVGPLRFRDPIKNKPWNGTLNALPQSPQCIQLDFARALQVHGQEDCLYLNVYTPQNYTGQPLPVMLFLHGGLYIFGAGSIYGPRYLLDRNVVLVTINFRLGPFGYFSTGDLESPGNQGLKDQVMALRWVQENIAAFGGDPSQVTLFGQSAGAASVQLHIVSPLSRGLFHRAIAESGSALCPWANIYNASEAAKSVGELYDCPLSSSKEMMECLRKVPAKLLAPVQLAFVQWFLFPLIIFGPTIEPEHSGAFMTKTPEQYYEDGEAQNVPLITGLTQDEMAFIVAGIILDPIHSRDINNHWETVGPVMMFLDYNNTEVNEERMIKLWDYYIGDQGFTWATRHNFSRLASDRFQTECVLEGMRYHSMYTNQSVYAYQFTYQGRYSISQQVGGKPEDWGVVHGDELIYLMNNPDYYQTLKPGDPELEMSYLLTTVWEQFAKHGIPYFPGEQVDAGGNGNLLASSTIWQPIEKATDIFSPLRFLDFNLNYKMIDDPYVDRYNFWRLEIDPSP